jgi:hypothetical protein
MEKKSLKTKDIRPRQGEMIKPGEIIGIGLEGWSLADRRTWNLLLMHAWGDDRLEDPNADFTISLHELRGLHDSNDRVRASLEKLQTTLVSARMPDGKRRTVQMLGGTDIDDDERTDGVLTYDFHRKLVPLLRRSEIYARMEVKILSAFTSKYSLALYEAISARINLHKSTEDISIDTLRQWFGVERDKLTEWYDLNRKAVQPALQEVNGLAPYMVTIEPIKRGRKVDRVRVTWSKKAPFSPAERNAVQEANRHSAGRVARLKGTVEHVAAPALSESDIQKGYEAAAAICRIDKQAAYTEWRGIVAGLPVAPQNPVGHFIEFCRKRAREIA